MHRLTATDTPMVRYTRTIFPSYANIHNSSFNSVVFKSEWNDILWPMDYSTFESMLHHVYVQR